MKEEQFININSNIWGELEQISVRINKKGINSLSSSEIKNFLYIFRQSSHHLAYARTHYPNSKTVVYLNSLIGKSHSHVYGIKKLSPLQFVKYFTNNFPKLLKIYRSFIIASFLFFAFGAIISYILVAYDSNNAALFLPSSFLGGTGNTNSGATPNWNYPLISAQIMTNNIGVCLKAFVMGLTLGLGTIYTLFYNGALIGALTAVTYKHGDPLRYWSLILPHGVIELSAIFISGAAGLIIAKSILLPGEYSRLHSLIAGSKKAVSLLIGVVFMLVIAGIIEGFFTPLNINPITKLVFAAITAVLLTVYFSMPYILKNRN